MKRQADAKGQKKPRFGYVRSIIAEMRKVAWPSRQEATRLTIIVLTVTTVIALALWGIDTAFAELVNAVLLK